MASIERTLEAMSFAKMSVLHWHIVDRESFPLVLESAPRLSLGAWTPEERYSSADVKRIVEFARLRGVRVVPEIDLPTHTASWCVGMPVRAPPTGLCPHAPAIWNPHELCPRAPLTLRPQELCPHAPVIWNQSSGKGAGRFDCAPCSPCEPLDPTVRPMAFAASHRCLDCCLRWPCAADSERV